MADVSSEQIATSILAKKPFYIRRRAALQPFPAFEDASKFPLITPSILDLYGDDALYLVLDSHYYVGWIYCGVLIEKRFLVLYFNIFKWNSTMSVIASHIIGTGGSYFQLQIIDIDRRRIIMPKNTFLDKPLYRVADSYFQLLGKSYKLPGYGLGSFSKTSEDFYDGPMILKD